MDVMNGSPSYAAAAAAAAATTPFAASPASTSASGLTPRGGRTGALALFRENDDASTTSPLKNGAGTPTAEDDNDNNNAFEAMMKEKSRQRKEREDAAVAALRVQVQRLQAALQAETKRRIAVTHQLSHERIATEIARLEHDLRTELAAQQAQSHERYSSLEQRLTALENSWKRNVLNMEKTIAKTTKELRDTVDSLRQSATLEQATRVHREESLALQLTELQQMHEQTWQTESQQREQSVQELQHQLWQHEQERTTKVDSYQGQLQNELLALQKELSQEKLERLAQDDAICQALNRYCAKLQKTMMTMVIDSDV
jgi:hypothetical protein